MTTSILPLSSCNRGASDLQQTELDLAAVLIDRLHLDEHMIAEAHFAVRRFSAEAVIALSVLPVIAADRGDGHHPLNEDLVELDEESERSDAGHDSGELLPHLVAHEDDFLPFQHFALGFFRASFALARLRRVHRMRALELLQPVAMRGAVKEQLVESPMHDEIGRASCRERV